MKAVEEIVTFLMHRTISLTTAESCTAGLIAARLNDVSGSGSVFFERGFVVYSPRAKNECLGVSYQTIERYGLSSEEVATEMALGALRHSPSSLAVANTGLAETDDNAMEGMVCFACALRVDGQERTISETVRFQGTRNEVREAAAFHALLYIPQYLEQLYIEQFCSRQDAGTGG